MTQPEALRLANSLAAHSLSRHGQTQAAAELRRLHAENERLHQINQSHEMKLSVRGYEIQIADLEAQRDALLEALELAADFLEHSTEFRIGHPGFEQAQAKARAAIKAVEGEKT